MPYVGFTSNILAEYNIRKRLASIGFTDNLGNLDCIKANCFIHIATEIDKQVDKKYKKKGKK